MKKPSRHLWIAGLVSLCWLAKTDMTRAQITSDGTLSTQVQTSNNQNFTITNGNRAGSNLFHSFREFSVPKGGSASFANSLEIKNIISRVTGASISNIDGRIETLGANLFLINPNGIIFGPNAQLDIRGSFVASTASHLLFADGSQFSATHPQTPPLLTVSVPIGLQFGQTAQPIQIEGSRLQVLTGKTLAMLGGDVLIKGGRLRAPEGRIELGGVTGNSLVSITPISSGWALGYEGVQNFQDIKVSLGAYINTSGEGNGAIQLRGRKIAIADKSQVGGYTQGEKPGQPLALKASESVEVSGGSQLYTSTTGAGAAGDIKIETRRLSVREGGRIYASTRGSGPGGNITVDAEESVEVLGDGYPTDISTLTYGTGNDAGNAGTVQISTPRVILRDGGRISTSTLGAGKGGTLRVDAQESVEASGRAVVNGNLPSGLFAETGRAGNRRITGDGGDLIIKTQRLVVQGGASVSVGAIDGSIGQAGTLEINASDSVTVSGTGIDGKGRVVPSTLLAASQGSGNAGDLTINTGGLTVRDRAAVSVSSTGSGKAGNLQITTGDLLLVNGGKLTAQTTAGQGNINLHSRNLILRRGSSIITDATGSNIAGGNITIDTDNLVAVPKEDSNISANSTEGRGGNVRISAAGIFGIKLRPAPTPLSDITATGKDSSFNGTVQINLRDVDPASGLNALPTAFVEPTRLIARTCTQRKGDSFIITGRGGLPPNPREPLRSQSVWVGWVTLNPQAQNSSSPAVPTNQTRPTPTPFVEAQGWVLNDKGQVVLTASPPNATHNNSFLSRSTPCSS